MRVVVPFAGRVHPLADAALRELAPDALRFDVAGSDIAYSQLVERLWRFGEGFTLVEHDIEVTPEALERARDCTCLWGRNSYGYSVGSTCASLGFVRFSSQLLAETRDLFEEIGAVHWGKFDSTLHGALERRGYVPCDHGPIPHHHSQSPAGFSLCTCGSRTPEEFCVLRRHHADAGCRCALPALTPWQTKRQAELDCAEGERLRRQRQRLYR